MGAALRSLRRFFTCTDGWAILACLLGAGSGLLPWAAPGAGSSFEWSGDNAFGLTRWVIPNWHGVAAVAAFALGALALAATYRPARPAWRPLLPLAAGGAALAAVALFFGWPGAGHVERWGDKAYPVEVSVLAGPYVALACGAVLLVIGALQALSLLLLRASANPAGTA